MSLARVPYVRGALLGYKLLASGRGRLWGRYSHLPVCPGELDYRAVRLLQGFRPPPKEPDPPGPPRLLWATQRGFDPSSSPSASK